MSFIKMVWPLYKGNKHWVPPLISDTIEILTPGKNPFWDHAERDLYLALRDNQVVGRIAAIISWKHNEQYNEKTGFFGFYESIEDNEVAKALYEAAEDWLRLRGMTHIRGPLSPNINEEIGFLAEGFDQDPFVMMTYTHHYYLELTKANGFKKIKDIYSYWASTTDGMPDKVKRVAEVVKKRYNITVRPIDLKNVFREAELLKQVHDEAWSENWGAVPFTDAEFEQVVKKLKPIAIPELVPMVELDGKIVAMGVAVPDANQVLRYANGRLFPFGFIKVLANQRKVDRIRILILGVLSKYRKFGLDALLYYEIYKTVEKHGFVGGEFSWILEDNYNIIRVIEGWGGKRTKTYRIFQKPIKPKTEDRKWDYLF